MRATPRRVALVGHTGRPPVRRAVKRLAGLLAKRGCDVRIAADMAAAVGLPGEPLPALAAWCQLMISLGGDGTVLLAGRALAGHRGTLLAINMGGLGFLAAAEANETDLAIEAVFAGRWPVSTRTGVETFVRRGETGRRARAGFALNDAVVRSGRPYSAVHLQVSALGHDLGHLVADGLIAASSSGSTAYALSAGGPMVAPALHALVVTPACAHALGSRSLVLPPDASVEARVLSPGPALLVLDGQGPIELARGDAVTMRLARRVVRVYENPARPFLYAIQSKLGWQGSERRSL